MPDIYTAAETALLRGEVNKYLSLGGASDDVKAWLATNHAARVTSIPRDRIGAFLSFIGSGVDLSAPMAERAHAVLSASGAARWLACPPSARLECEYIEPQSSFANEGSYAHKIAERRLSAYVQGREFARPCDCDAEMWAATGEYADLCVEKYVAAQRDSPDAKILIEERLDFSNYVPKGFGTGDCVIISDERLEVIDFKYGKGVPVYAEGNPQMRLYALGALNEYGLLYGAKEVVTTIAQPRLCNRSSETLTVAELVAWGKSVAPTADMAFRGEGEQKAGPHCRFCKARVHCRALRDYYDNCLKRDFEPLKLTPDELAEIVAKAKDCKSWLTDCEEHALQSAMKGARYSGLKLVLGRSRRQIDNTERACELLASAGYDAAAMLKPPQLKPITELEKLMGKKEFNETLGEVIAKSTPKPQLVPAGDKRSEVTPADIVKLQFEGEI